MTGSLPPGGTVFEAAELDARWADAWRPEQVAERLGGVGAPWRVAAGWALDLFRGERSRPHGDLEIAVPAAGFAEVSNPFPEYVFDAVGTGHVWAGPTPRPLRPPTRRGCGIRRAAVSSSTSSASRTRTGRGSAGGTPRLRLPYDAVIERTADGIPYMAPELVLLFKAKAARPKDRADFDGVLPLLGRPRRDTLGRLLERVHPGHPWTARLAAASR